MWGQLKKITIYLIETWPIQSIVCSFTIVVHKVEKKFLWNFVFLLKMYNLSPQCFTTWRYIFTQIKYTQVVGTISILPQKWLFNFFRTKYIKRLVGHKFLSPQVKMSPQRRKKTYVCPHNSVQVSTHTQTCSLFVSGLYSGFHGIT